MSDIPTRPMPFLVTLNPDHVATLSGPSLSLGDVAQTIRAEVQGFRALSDAQTEEIAVETLGAPDADPHTLLVTLSAEERDRLAGRFGTAVTIEPDIDLEMFDSIGPDAGVAGGFQPAGLAPLNFFATSAGELVLEITVTSADGTPVARAEVSGRGSSAFSLETDVTDAAGKASLTFFGETPASLRELKVKPSANHWGLVIPRPDLSGLRRKKGAYQVTLTLEPIRLDGDETAVWGYRAMGLDRAAPAPDADTAEPVRIAVIDSGISASHEDLDPAGGRDFTNRGDADKVWREDLSGHGTHVAGTCAAQFNARGICGAAGPGTRLFGLSVFPGGRTSSLIGALDWCVANRIDVANLSLGSPQGTSALHQAVIRATQAGVTLVAAAGNAARPVMFPAAYPEVIAVAALGKIGSFPANSPDAEHIGPHRAGEYFVAGFTCFGPEVDVTAPGVAVISTVPSDSNDAYAACSGTSMASPYVTGFVARLLACRADLRGLPRAGARVAALKSALLDCCEDLGLPAEYQGHGLPVWRQGASPGGTQGLLGHLRRVSAQLGRELA